MRYANEAFLETLTDEQLLELAPPEPVGAMSTEMAPLVGQADVADLTILTTATPSVLNQVNYLDELATFTEAFHLRARTDAMSDADAASQREAIAIITMSVLGAALAIALALFVTRFVGPFLRLHRRAEVVASGNLPARSTAFERDPRAEGRRRIVRRDVGVARVDRSSGGRARDGQARLRVPQDANAQ